MNPVWLIEFLRWLLRERSDLLRDCLKRLRAVHAEKTPAELSRYLTFCEPQCRYYKQISGDRINDVPGLSNGLAEAAYSAAAAEGILRSALVASQHQLLLTENVPEDPVQRADLLLRQLTHALRANRGIPLPEVDLPVDESWPALPDELRENLANDYLTWWSIAEHPGRAGFRFGYMLYRPVFATLVFLHLKSVGLSSYALLNDGRIDPWEDHHLRDNHAHTTRVVLEALLAIAYADGIIQQEELRLFYAYGRTLGMESGFNLHDFGTEDLEDLKDLLENDQERECLVELLGNVANADGLVHPLEREFLHRVCEVLNVELPV